MTDISLWRNRDFRLFIGASAFAQLGHGIFAVAFPWLATLLTRDPLLIGMVGMAPILPWLLFALPTGVLTDRLDHRLAIIWTNPVRAALITGSFVLALTTVPAFRRRGGAGALSAASAVGSCNLGWHRHADLLRACAASGLMQKRGRAQGPARSNREDAGL